MSTKVKPANKLNDESYLPENTVPADTDLTEQFTVEDLRKIDLIYNNSRSKKKANPDQTYFDAADVVEMLRKDGASNEDIKETFKVYHKHKKGEDYKSKFAEGARLSAPPTQYKTELEWTQRGILTFKRKTLGMCGKKTVKSLDELAKILTKMKVLNSTDNVENFMAKIEDNSLDYGPSSLHIKKVRSKERIGYELVKIPNDSNGFEY